MATEHESHSMSFLREIVDAATPSFHEVALPDAPATTLTKPGLAGFFFWGFVHPVGTTSFSSPLVTPPAGALYVNLRVLSVEAAAT
jgi:hypothetical protein